MNHRRIFITATVACLVALSQVGCFYDIEDELYPSSICDTTQVSYTLDIRPIIQASCIGCHSGSSSSGGILLETYSQLSDYVSNGLLSCTIEHASGCSPMPKNSAQLSPCKIDRIKRWIAEGAIEN